MKLLAVVTPPSIYHKVSARKHIFRNTKEMLLQRCTGRRMERRYIELALSGVNWGVGVVVCCYMGGMVRYSSTLVVAALFPFLI